ncbi:protein K [Gilliamella sp. BG1]|uniref:protein K n=1 Tax=Gilliamella sp. BG1 TaxID=3351508 RepID=UPI003987D1FD
MKGMKVTFVMLMGIILFGFNNSEAKVIGTQRTGIQENMDIVERGQNIIAQSTPEKIKEFNEQKDGDYSFAQDSVVAGIKEKLPIVIDKFTMFNDISKDNNKLIYKYIIKGLPKDVILLKQNQQSVLKTIVTLYCGNDPNVEALKLIFPNGVSHNYYLENEKIMSFDLKPSDCDSK